MLLFVAIAIARMKDLLAVIMLLGVYGLLSASFFVTMDAVDVAFTEASVGAGISTILMLMTVAITGRNERSPSYKPAIAIILVLITGGLLVYGTLDMPFFGLAEAPANLHVAPRYILDSMQETGMPNIVTSVLASYRGFDTFGEVAVIFTAGIGVLAMFGVMSHPKDHTAEIDSTNASMHEEHLVLRIVSKILIPFILLFALYVQFHGDFGPGGGFQAGVIFAAAIILYSMLFGMNTTRRVINQSFVRVISALGLMLYGTVGIVSLLNGGNFLDYSVLAENPTVGQHIGILVIELGVGCTVTSVMVIIFVSFASRIEHLNINKARGK